MGILLFLFSVLGYSLSNAYWKKSIRNTPFIYLVFCRGLITTSFFGILTAIDHNSESLRFIVGPIPTINAQLFIYSVLICAFSFWGLYFFLKSMKKGNSTLTNTISSINIFGILTALFILNEPWYNYYWIVFTLIIVAIIILNFKSIQQENSIDIKFGVLASFFWGVSYALFSYPIQWLGVTLFTFLLELIVTLMCGILLLKQKINFQLILWKNVGILAACIIWGSIFLHISYLYIKMTDLIILQKLNIVMSLLFSQILYKEKLTKLQWSAILMIVIAISISVFY